jgi:hypothetical protein
MNLQALFDGLLAVTAFYVAKQTAPTGVALRLSACLLGVAATLGALFRACCLCRNCTSFFLCWALAWACHYWRYL